MGIAIKHNNEQEVKRDINRKAVQIPNTLANNQFITDIQGNNQYMVIDFSRKWESLDKCSIPLISENRPLTIIFRPLVFFFWLRLHRRLILV